MQKVMILTIFKYPILLNVEWKYKEQIEKQLDSSGVHISYRVGKTT